MKKIIIDIPKQKLFLSENEKIIKIYSVSTAAKGVGEEKNSEKTPRGLHYIRAKIGDGCAPNTVFVGRRPTGEIFSPELKKNYPGRDWILTRILWLSGLELGKNRLGKVDTQQRYIYIHGAPDTAEMGKPGSKGCVRLSNQDMIELFNAVNFGDKVLINS